MKLILIHGRDQHRKPKDELLTLWKSALEEGLSKSGLSLPENLEIGFPYYGDFLYDIINRIPSFEDILVRGPQSTVEKEYLKFQQEILEELASINNLKQKQIQDATEELVLERGPLNSKGGQAIAKALDKSFIIGQVILRIFTEDTYSYLHNPTIQEKIDSLVLEEFNAPECVVIGHSMGSIVGYNVLRKLSGVNVRSFITIGSPLGIRGIKSRLKHPLVYPSSLTGQWHNLYDKKDGVALQPLNDTHFPIKPPILNESSVTNSTENHHGIEGYLSDPLVAKTIHEAF